MFKFVIVDPRAERLIDLAGIEQHQVHDVGLRILIQFSKVRFDEVISLFARQAFEAGVGNTNS